MRIIWNKLSFPFHRHLKKKAVIQLCSEFVFCLKTSEDFSRLKVCRILEHSVWGEKKWIWLQHYITVASQRLVSHLHKTQIQGECWKARACLLELSTPQAYRHAASIQDLKISPLYSLTHTCLLVSCTLSLCIANNDLQDGWGMRRTISCEIQNSWCNWMAVILSTWTWKDTVYFIRQTKFPFCLIEESIYHWELSFLIWALWCRGQLCRVINKEQKVSLPLLNCQ